MILRENFHIFAFITVYHLKKFYDCNVNTKLRKHLVKT